MGLIWDDERRFTVENIERLEGPPQAGDPEDAVWWKADVHDIEDGPLPVYPWVVGTDEAEIPEEPDEWITGELARFYRGDAGEDIGTMYAFRCIRLRPRE